VPWDSWRRPYIDREHALRVKDGADHQCRSGAGCAVSPGRPLGKSLDVVRVRDQYPFGRSNIRITTERRGRPCAETSRGDRLRA
jgi:hypothetical protein